MRKIEITRGHFAIIDDEDYESVEKFKWRYSPSFCSGYAIRGQHVGFEDGKQVSKTISMHRFIMNAPEGMEVDHINGNGLDNRRCNLRIATRSQNKWNRRKLQPKSSRFKGVHWEDDRKKWRAYIYKNNRRTIIGRFDNELDAALAYNKYAKELFSDFASLNEVVL